MNNGKQKMPPFSIEKKDILCEVPSGVEPLYMVLQTIT